MDCTAEQLVSEFRRQCEEAFNAGLGLIAAQRAWHERGFQDYSVGGLYSGREYAFRRQCWLCSGVPHKEAMAIIESVWP